MPAVLEAAAEHKETQKVVPIAEVALTDCLLTWYVQGTREEARQVCQQWHVHGRTGAIARGAVCSGETTTHVRDSTLLGRASREGIALALKQKGYILDKLRFAMLSCRRRCFKAGQRIGRICSAKSVDDIQRQVERYHSMRFFACSLLGRRRLSQVSARSGLCSHDLASMQNDSSA